jgi:hypothetical protein
MAIRLLDVAVQQAHGAVNGQGEADRDRGLARSAFAGRYSDDPAVHQHLSFFLNKDVLLRLLSM